MRKEIYGVPVKKDKDLSYIDWDDIPKEYKEEFGKWMEGQTCPLINGKGCVYTWDWERWMDFKTGKTKFTVWD